MKIKNYKKPVISAITLNPDQAILQVCQVGGAYFGGGGQPSNCLFLGGLVGCDLTVRGTKHIAGGFGSVDASPS
ncbi:MAG: hypothetical protein PHQ52_06955 [Candidatus Omnitrophica bacterium]|jgi:hypothetical protein|nr:hypothetical protein [Candidatus Omnitrophota bacterium]